MMILDSVLLLATLHMSHWQGNYSIILLLLLLLLVVVVVVVVVVIILRRKVD